jgi:hypothetical protein
MLSDDATARSLDEVEVEAERRSREVMRRMLEAHFQRRGTGDLGPALEVVTPEPNGRVSVRRHGERRLQGRTIHSIFGEVPVARTAYCAEGAESVHPLDEMAALPERTFSYELQRRVITAAVQGPFDESIERVEESTSVRLSKRSAEEVLREGARDFDAFYATRTPPAAAESGPLLVAAVDCKGVPMVKPEQALRVVRRGKGEKANKKRMATVAAVFTQQPRPRTPEEVVESLFDSKPRLVDADPAPPRPRPEHKRVWASLEKSKDEVISDVAREVDRRDPERTKKQVVVTDGERALQKRVTSIIFAAIVILDFLHVLEKLWKAAYCFFEEGSEEAKLWVRERALRILRGEVSQVIKGMRKSATARGLSGAKRKTIDGVARYYHRNWHRMRYHEYLRLGLPIASGSVEGACNALDDPNRRGRPQAARRLLEWRPPGILALPPPERA